MSRIFRKNVFTGELEEDSQSNVAADFEVVNARSRAKTENLVGGRSNDPWAGGKDFIAKSMSIAPEQATPERIAKENADAKKHGTGAYYTPDGGCYMPTRGVRAREMVRKNRQDNDAGYGDEAGGGFGDDTGG